MFQAGKCAIGADRDAHRASAEFRDAVGRHRRAHTLTHRLGLAAVLVWCWAGYAAADDVPVSATAPVKIAVFAFELEDFTAAAEQGSSPVVTSALVQSTEEAKQQLHQSGRYELIDTAGADMGAAKGQGLRNCSGCEAAIAARLGADQAMIGVVTKISMTEYEVTLRVSDARSGKVVAGSTTGLRMGASDSWFRGVRWLMKNRMLVSK